MYCIDIHSIASYSIFSVSVFISLFFPFPILSVDIFLFDVFQLFLRHFYLSIFSFSTFSVNSEFCLSFHFDPTSMRTLPLERKQFDTSESSCNCLKAIDATHDILVENVKQWVYTITMIQTMLVKHIKTNYEV